MSIVKTIPINYNQPHIFTNTSLKEAVNQWIADPTVSIFTNQTDPAYVGNISIWNTSQVTDMSDLFMDAITFNDSINSWDVSSVTNMSNMFKHATAFNKPLDTWNVSLVTNMHGMFSYANSFNQPLYTRHPISRTRQYSIWNVSSSVRNMDEMFLGASSFNQHDTIDSWNITPDTSIISMFLDASSYNRSIDALDIPENDIFSIDTLDIPENDIFSIDALDIPENDIFSRSEPELGPGAGVQPFTMERLLTRPLERQNAGIFPMEHTPLPLQRQNAGPFPGRSPGYYERQSRQLELYQLYRRSPLDFKSDHPRNKLKNYTNNHQIMLSFSDIDIDNRNVQSFYKQIMLNESNQFNSIPQEIIKTFFFNRWTVKFIDATRLLDNDDVGGYSKAVFSHFAKYCLFYDDKLLNKKKEDLNEKLESLKSDYKQICEKRQDTSPGKYVYIKDVDIKSLLLKANCYRLDFLKTINSVEHEDYVNLTDEEKEFMNNKFMGKQYFEHIKPIRNKYIVEFWWSGIKKDIISEYDIIECANNDYNKFKDQIEFIPFVIHKTDERISLKINNKLNEEKIKVIYGTVEIYYLTVGRMLGKYITQELHLWQGGGGVQYATDYIPIGKLLALLILRNKQNLTKKTIYEVIDYDHNNNKIFEKQIKEEYSDIILPTGDEDLLERDTIEKIIKFYLCHNDDKLKGYFDSFLEGIHQMMKTDSKIFPEELILIFECKVGVEKVKFLSLLNKETKKFRGEKLHALKFFIKIISEMEATELPRLYEFISGTKCCPDTIKIEFNTYNILFTSHLCSNGLDFPNYNTDYVIGKPIRALTKEELKSALETSLASSL